MKKKFLSLALALVMCLGLCVPAYAAPVSIKSPTGKLTITLSDVISEEDGKAYDSPCKVYVMPVGSTISTSGNVENVMHWFMPAKQTSGNRYDDEAYYPIPSEGLKLERVFKTYLGDLKCDVLYVGIDEDTEKNFLVKITDKAAPAAPGASKFSDVAANSPFKDAISWAVEQGITNGTGGGKFSPVADCTRGQIVTFLYRAAQAAA